MSTESDCATRERVREAIAASKERPWAELLESVESDPWGRPYRLVINRLWYSSKPVAQELEPEFLMRVLNHLSPSADPFRFPMVGDDAANSG